MTLFKLNMKHYKRKVEDIYFRDEMIKMLCGYKRRRTFYGKKNYQKILLGWIVSSFQTEGHRNEGGKGLCVYDVGTYES